jgi:DNA-binding NtrC family response regulator
LGNALDSGIRVLRDERSRMADESRFRPDLLFRLNTVEIELPPLRQRREDIPLLLDHYLGLYARKYDKPVTPLSGDVLIALTDYDWPGNVRALRHAAERAVILSDGGPLSIDDFSIRRQAGHIPVVTVEAASDLNLERAEKQMIERALQKHSYNISLAANELGLTRASLYRRMEKHAL